MTAATRIGISSHHQSSALVCSSPPPALDAAGVEEALLVARGLPVGAEVSGPAGVLVGVVPVGVGRSRVGENDAVTLGRSPAPPLPAPPQAVRSGTSTTHGRTARRVRPSMR